MEIDFTNEEVQSALKEAGYLTSDDAKAMVENEVKGLKSKNEELIGKLKSGNASKAELIELQSQLEEIENQKLEDEKNWGKLKENLTGKMESLQRDHDAKVASLNSALIERDLFSELVKANVAPHFLDAVKAMHRDSITYNEGKMLVGEQSLSEYVNEWAQSDAGKHFVSAPDNNGGGAPGGRGGSGDKTVTREEFNKLPPRKQSDFLLKEGGKVVD